MGREIESRQGTALVCKTKDSGAILPVPEFPDGIKEWGESRTTNNTLKPCFTKSFKYSKVIITNYFPRLPPNTPEGFDLTTHTSSLLGGRRRRYH
jgi:hypothetical protein